MNKQTNKAVAAHGTELPGNAVSTNGESKGATQSLADVQQETEIWTSIERNPHLRAHNIKVFVSDGIATLTGFVSDGTNKELAKFIALGVNGVIQVNNQILIESDCGAPPPPSIERSYGEMIDDANITSAIKSKLMWSQYSNGLSTDVDTAWGKVTLTGTVDSEVAKALAGRFALNTPGVLSVDNLLVISLSRSALEHNAAVAADEKARDVADSWISTKVRSTFLYTRNINSHDIVVDTHDGVVTLTGKVGSVVERDFAIELAQHVRGVKQVIADALYC